MDKKSSASETPVDPAAQAAVAKATELQEVTHNGFVGNWPVEEPSGASPESAVSADNVGSDDAGSNR